MQQKSRAHRATAPTYTYRKHMNAIHLQKTQKAELFNAAALKNELNFATFKSDLKTYLFREAFNL